MDTTFIDELASAAPTPGGGGAASYVGAVASALASMVGNLTVGKKTYAAVEDDVRATLERLALLRNKLHALIDHADFLARNGSKLAVSDAGAAAVLARAAVVAASMNVYINAASMDDEARADRYRAEADRLIAEANERADGILAYTMDAIR